MNSNIAEYYGNAVSMSRAWSTCMPTYNVRAAPLVFKDVPAEVCGNCGEAFHSEEVTRALLAQAEEAARSGVEVDVRRYAAA